MFDKLCYMLRKQNLWPLLWNVLNFQAVGPVWKALSGQVGLWQMMAQNGTTLRILWHFPSFCCVVLCRNQPPKKARTITPPETNIAPPCGCWFSRCLKLGSEVVAMVLRHQLPLVPCAVGHCRWTDRLRGEKSPWARVTGSKWVWYRRWSEQQGYYLFPYEHIYPIQDPCIFAYL